MTFPPLRAWLLVVFTSLFLLTLCYFTMGRLGLFAGLTLSLFWNYAMLLHKHKNAKEHFSAKLIEGRDAWDLGETITNFQNQIRCPRTDLYLCQDSHPLLMASTSEWGKPYLLISQSLIDLLTPNELNSLIALGLATIKQRQTFFRYTLNRMALSWMSLGLLIDNILPFRDLQLALRLHYLVAWLHLKVAYPQSLQAKADLEAFQNIAHSRDLATALWKIHGRLDTDPLYIPQFLAHESLLEQPKFRRGAFQFILPIELRLRFLVGYFPI